MATNTKSQLLAQLKEVEKQLKAFQKQFRDIKKRVGKAVSAARNRSDARKLSDLRKKIGLN